MLDTGLIDDSKGTIRPCILELNEIEESYEKKLDNIFLGGSVCFI